MLNCSVLIRHLRLIRIEKSNREGPVKIFSQLYAVFLGGSGELQTP